MEKMVTDDRETTSLKRNSMERTIHMSIHENLDKKQEFEFEIKKDIAFDGRVAKKPINLAK